MRFLRAVFVAALLAATYFVGGTAIEQYENYQEFGMKYFTPLHLFNIIALAIVAVAILVFAISVSIGRFQEDRAFLGNYIRVVLLGSAGAVAVGVGWYENEVTEGLVYPYIQHAYHWGDIAAVWAVAAALVMLAAYYLFRENDEVAQSARRTRPEPAEPRTTEEYDPKPGFEVELRDGNLVIRGDYPEADKLRAIVSLLQSRNPAPASYGIFGQPFGAPISSISFQELGEILKKRAEDLDRESGRNGSPSDHTPADEVPQS